MHSMVEGPTAKPASCRPPPLQRLLDGMLTQHLRFTWRSGRLCVHLLYGLTLALAVRLDGSGADELVIEVANGGDIPAATRDTLFEPFHSGRPDSPPTRGLGLGLFIGRTLLERSGARVEFANDGGAVARVTWPEAALAATDRAALGRNPVIAD